tara:strand:+ start:124 stop:936 length:813 start_codon:yes stop_codon:yes gene_type:complete
MKISNNTNRDMSILTKTLESFIPYTQERLGYDKPFQVFFESDEENSKNIFGKTAYYDPATMNIHVYVDGRHDKDMLRSISHEVVHHHQNCRGDFDGAFEMGEGYAQKSPHLRNMEAEAYLLGNGFLVRDFEDSVKTGDTLMKEWKEDKKEPLAEATSFSKLQMLLNKIKLKAPAQIEALKSAALEVDKTTLAKIEALVLRDLLDVDAKELAATAGAAKALLQRDASSQQPEQQQEQKSTLKKENVKEHYKNKNKKLNEELMKKWFKKGEQ